MEQPVEPQSGDEGTPASTGQVSELPLFPLDVVLFPHMHVPLRIFEERYKTMVSRCVRESAPFGIVLVSDVHPSTGRVNTSNIGCTARIERVERLPDGQMNIEVVGGHRFRILDSHETEPYRIGLIEPVEDNPADASAVMPLADDVHRLLRDFLTRSLAIVGRRIDGLDLPDEPEQLSFTAASVLPVENAQKQVLLEDMDTAARLASEREVLLREVTRLRRAAETSDSVSSRVWRPIKSDRLSAYLSVN